ncbi:MAG TPA: hypothetical protein VEI97_06565 [bacterium]|nr:hypothetical protein [bacterium]
MTRKLYPALLALGFTALLAPAAQAADDDDVVTVTVNAIDLLDVPATAALTLTTSTPGATDYDQGTRNQPNGLLFSHNKSTDMKITATAVADGGNAANDITLTVAIEGQAAGTVVDAGSDEANVLLWDDIPSDGYTKDLDWTADGSLADTHVGSYVWTVTFTTSDA